MDPIFLIIMNIVLFVSMVTISLWLIVPKGFYFIEKWKDDRNPRSFSVAIFCFFVAVSFLFFVGIWGARKVTEFVDFYFPPEYLKLVIFLVISYFLIYFSMPKAILFFQKWKSKAKTNYFSLSALFAFISIFFMWVIFSLYLPAFTR